MNDKLLHVEQQSDLVDETRGFWREVARDMVRDSIQTVDETGKQIVTITGILEGLYFHAIVFSDLRGDIHGNLFIIYFAPVILFLSSLIMALIIFIPDRYNINIHSSEAGKKIYEATLKSKLIFLRLASLFLVLGVGAVGISIAFYLLS